MKAFILRRLRLAGPVGFTIIIAGLLLLAPLALAQSLMRNSFEQDLHLISTAHEIQHQSALAHLWFVEAMSGDNAVNLDRDVYAHIDAARELSRVMYNGGPASFGTLAPVSDAEIRRELAILRDQLESFRSLTAAIWSDRQHMTVGAPSEKLYDAAFEEILRSSERIVQILHQNAVQHEQTISLINLGITPLAILIFIGMGTVVMRLYHIVEQQVAERTVALQRTNERLQHELSARERIEQALRESEANYRTLVEKTPAIVYTAEFGAAGKWFFVSPQIEEILGFAPDEWLADPTFWARQLHPDDRQYVLVEDERCRITGEPFRAEYRMLTRDGQVVWMRDDASVIQIEAGRAPYMHGILLNITERKQMEAALRESEARFHTLYEASFEGIALHERGVIVDGNHALAVMFGYELEEMIGKNALDFTAPESYEHVQANIRAGHDQPYEAIGLRKDGTHFPVDVVGKKMQHQRRELRVAAIRDISDRKQAEAALRESEARFRSAFDDAAIGMALVATDGRWLQVNQALCDLVGYSDAEMRATTFQAITHPDDLAMDLQCIEQMVNGAIHTYQMEKRYIHKQGRAIWILLSVSLVRDQSGQPLYFVAQIQNITARVQAEAAVHQTNAQLAMTVKKLQRHTTELTRLSELSALLQVCRTADEIYQVAAATMPTLFPAESGFLSIFKDSQNYLEVVAHWGGATHDQTFGPDDCVALRRGRMYLAHHSQDGFVCAHIGHPPPGSYLCLPLMARGQALGVLHISQLAENELSIGKQRLAQAAASQFELTLANVKLQETLRYHSIRDPLTGLFNRRYMEESLEREVRRAERNGHPIGVIMLDVDHFKQFNDTFGHLAGDRVLSEIGRLLQTHSRGEDIVCRYGGEEFALILPEASAAATRQRAEALREACCRLRINYRGQLLGPVTLSLGMAIFPDHGATGTAMLQAADIALYAAKHAGRNCVEIAHIGVDN